MQEAQTGESKAGTSILSGMTRLPAPTLWSLSYCSSFPTTGRYATTVVPSPSENKGTQLRTFARKGEGARATEVAEVVKAQIALTPPDPLLLVEVEGKRKIDFLVKPKSQSLVGKKAIQVQ